MRSKPIKVIGGWKYRFESPNHWRQSVVKDVDYGDDVNAVLAGIQNKLSIPVTKFDPASERIDTFCIAVSDKGKRKRVRLIEFPATSTLQTSGGVDSDDVIWLVANPTTSTDFNVGDFFKIEDEICQITAITPGSPNDTWTVRRGEHGTTGAAHTQSTVVRRLDWSIAKGYKEIVLSGSPETIKPGAAPRLVVLAPSDANGNRLIVELRRPTTGSRTLRKYQIQVATALWDTDATDAGTEDTTTLKGILAEASDGIITQGGQTLTTATDLTAAGVLAGHFVYTHEGKNNATGEIDFGKAWVVDTVTDNGDSTWTITLAGDDSFFLSSGEQSTTTNFICASGWQGAPTDFVANMVGPVPKSWNGESGDPTEQVIIENQQIGADQTVYVRIRWWNLNGTGPWLYWDGTTGTTTQASAVTIAPVGMGSGGILDNAITNLKVAAGAIGNAELAALAVDAAKLASGAVTGPKIAAGAVAAGAIAAGAIIAGKIAAGVITATEMSANSIDTSQLVADAIDVKHTIIGSVFKTAGSGKRIEEDSTNGLRAFDSAGNVWLQIPLSTTGTGEIQVTRLKRISSVLGTFGIYGRGSGDGILIASRDSADSSRQSISIEDGASGIVGLNTANTRRFQVDDTEIKCMNGVDLIPSGSGDGDEFLGSGSAYWNRVYTHRINFKELAAPSTPATGTAWVYLDSDGDYKIKFDSGNVATIQAAI